MKLRINKKVNIIYILAWLSFNVKEQIVNCCIIKVTHIIKIAITPTFNYRLPRHKFVDIFSEAMTLAMRHFVKSSAKLKNMTKNVNTPVPDHLMGNINNRFFKNKFDTTNHLTTILKTHSIGLSILSRFCADTFTSLFTRAVLFLCIHVTFRQFRVTNRQLTSLWSTTTERNNTCKMFNNKYKQCACTTKFSIQVCAYIGPIITIKFLILKSSFHMT